MLKALKDYRSAEISFERFVISLSPPIEGISFEFDEVSIGLSTKLYQMSGVTQIHGLRKADDFEITLLKEDDPITEEEGKRIGLGGETITLSREELRPFLEKLVNQTF